MIIQPVTPSRKTKPWVFYICLGILGVAVAVAVFADWAAPYDPSATDFSALYQQPTAEHWFGTDQLGRDLLSRVIHGARPSLLGAIALLAFATATGVLIGIVAAWRRGWVDTVLARLTDVMFAFPGLLFVVLVIAVFDRGPATAVIGMGLAFAPVIAKFTRAVALEELSRPYVDTYRLQGVGPIQLCTRYVLPNLMPTLLGYLVVLFGEGLLSLAALNFLGFGAQPPSSEWGLMVQEGRSGVIQGFVGPALIPGLAIAIVVVATNVVGVRLSDKLAVRT
ncbi:ABC transporter permease [Kibdelosporangium aridum]|uniref:Peptide/nickel transport system permease protein n=1 Tax=Kibdelosporangium aridum TaxID=2030 RepID=A0A1W2FBK7_KIBAR|nr:ABC transporter permease [Kibdelosporangium aridum]SMD19369.1 peptide/nickel transport system permease protein [Kibdelosporangium aridum]